MAVDFSKVDKVPSSKLDLQVANLQPRESGWIAPQEVTVSYDDVAFIYTTTPVSHTSSDINCLYIRRREGDSPTFYADWLGGASHTFRRCAYSAKELAGRMGYYPIVAWEQDDDAE